MFDQIILNTILSVVSLTGIGIVSFLLKRYFSGLEERITDLKSYVGKCVDELWKSVDNKAEDKELTRVRDAQNAIFKKIEDHEKEDRDRHAQTMVQLGKLEGMMSTLVQRKRGSDD